MKNYLGGLISAAMLITGATGALAQDRVVNIYNWYDYIDPQILENFTEETGIKVVYDTYDTNLKLEAQLLAGGTGYDIVVPTTSFAERQIQAGVFQPLDKSKLPNLKHEWPLIRDIVHRIDPEGKYTVNYVWGTMAFGYNVDKVKELLQVDKVDSWSVLFDPENAKKLSECGIYVNDAPISVIPAALTYLGLEPTDFSSENLAKAEEALMAIRPYIRKFDSSEAANALANGDICIAFLANGWALQARDRAKEANNGITIEYGYPKEGVEIWLDVFAIPADAPHVEEAHEFINYMLRPEVAALASDYINFPNGNLASQKHIKPEDLADPAIYPADEDIAKMFVNRSLSPKVERELNRMYTRVVTGQ